MNNTQARKRYYLFLGILGILLYLIYLIAYHSYQDYQVSKYREEIKQNISLLQKKIKETELFFEQVMTPAYKNKILKSEQGLKNPGEEVLFLISEERYKSFTEERKKDLIEEKNIGGYYGDEKKLIESMSIFEKWVYLLFKKDIR